MLRNMEIVIVFTSFVAGCVSKGDRSRKSEDAAFAPRQSPARVLILDSEKMNVSRPAELNLGSIRVLLEELPAGEDTGASYAAYRMTVFQNGKQSKVFVSEEVHRGSASVQVGELDLKNEFPEVVFSGFTGGAHCCQVRSIFFAQQGQKEWGQLDDSYDGDFQAAVDYSGLGRLVFKGRDGNFLYSFSSYAESWAPIQFMALENGKLVNVTREPTYRRHLEEQLNRMKKEKSAQREGSNGYWAAYVALHAILGDEKTAWEDMLKGYDQESTLGLKTCVERDSKQECLKEESFPVVPRCSASFPEQGRIFEGRSLTFQILLVKSICETFRLA